ncbi:hypothetical protein BAE44_0023432 [Dichanthelium oligosanthes]|uniref:Uncharacterized protein n=1 Tax=Dichanthelium oligosanthes TaxID=888268 RepID=A0A1E5URM5_9POAL|nr:hypothetical protein BAE44_0023432 [Dichanthelium oligosanthes]
MAATIKQSSTTSPFNFLKEGLLLPSQNRRLFAAIFTISVTFYSLFLAASELGVQRLALQVRRDIDALDHTDRRSPGYGHLLRELHEDSRDFLLASAAYLLLAVLVGSVTNLVAIFAAVRTYSGEVHTFGSLLGKARAQLMGPVLTLAFVYTLEITGVALLLALAALFVFLAFKRYLGLLLADSLLLLVAYIFFVYLSFVCSLGIVVAVAEPGTHGAGAVGRAWQLMKGKQRRAMLLITVTGVLAAVFSPFYWLTKIFAHSKMASGALFLGFLYSVQMAAVELFNICTLTALYHECKERYQAQVTEYVKLPVQDV